MSAYALLAPRNVRHILCAVQCLASALSFVVIVFYMFQEHAVPETNSLFFAVDDAWQDHRSLPERVSVSLGTHLGVESRRVVIFNSLTWERQEVVYLQVSSPHVKVLTNCLLNYILLLEIKFDTDFKDLGFVLDHLFADF